MLTLREVLNRKHLTAAHLAAVCGVTVGTAQSWIRGKRKLHCNKLSAIQELLSLTTDEASEILVSNRKRFWQRKHQKQGGNYDKEN